MGDAGRIHTGAHVLTGVKEPVVDTVVTRDHFWGPYCSVGYLGNRLSVATY